MLNCKFRLHDFYRQEGQRLGDEGRVCHTWQGASGTSFNHPPDHVSNQLTVEGPEPGAGHRPRTGPCAQGAARPHNPEPVRPAEAMALGAELSLRGLSCPGESVLGPRCLSPGGPPSRGVPWCGALGGGGHSHMKYTFLRSLYKGPREQFSLEFIIRGDLCSYKENNLLPADTNRSDFLFRPPP